MNVKRGNEPEIVDAVIALLKARRAVGFAKDRIREFDASESGHDGIVIRLCGNGRSTATLTLASTNEVKAALKKIESE